MKTVSIIKIEALTLSKKILNQIEWHTHTQEMLNCAVGWCSDGQSTKLISRTLDGRLYKSSVSKVSEIKNGFPQIFLK